MNAPNLPVKQQGVILIEGLIAILIFSMGILALMGLQAVAISYSTAAKYRADASYLADQIVSEMWAGGGANTSIDGFACNPCTAASGTGNANLIIANWIADINVTAGLPNAVSGTSPVITVATTATGGRQVTVTLRWRAPNETQTHNYSLITNINRNY